METKVVKIEGMSCDHCKASVTDTLRAVPGIRSVDVDLGAAAATVSVDPDTVSWDKVKQEVEAAGYKVVGIEDED